MLAADYQHTISYPSTTAYDNLMDQVRHHDLMSTHGILPFSVFQQMWRSHPDLGSFDLPECLRDDFATACQPLVGRTDVNLGVGLCPLNEVSAISDHTRTTRFAQTAAALRAIMHLVTTNIRWRCWNDGTGCMPIQSFERDAGACIIQLTTLVMEICFDIKVRSIMNVGGSSVTHMLERTKSVLPNMVIESDGVHLTLMQTTLSLRVRC